MILVEIFDNELLDTRQDPSEDQSVPKLKDVRKTKLTLADIHKLRMMSDVRRFEKESALKDIQRQYGAKPESAGGI